MSEFEPTSHTVTWEGKVIQAGTESYRYDDGAEATHDRIWHPGAVSMLPVDDQYVWLVRQPREAAGLAHSLEIPAGKRDRPGEPILDLAKRELVEEVGKQAGEWREILSFYPTPGFSDEELWIFLATDLSDVPGGPTPDADERLEIVPWPLVDLDGALAQTQDAKTLIGLMWLARQPFASANAS